MFIASVSEAFAGGEIPVHKTKLWTHSHVDGAQVSVKILRLIGTERVRSGIFAETCSRTKDNTSNNDANFPNWFKWASMSVQSRWRSLTDTSRCRPSHTTKSESACRFMFISMELRIVRRRSNVGSTSKKSSSN